MAQIKLRVINRTKLDNRIQFRIQRLTFNTRAWSYKQMKRNWNSHANTIENVSFVVSDLNWPFNGNWSFLVCSFMPTFYFLFFLAHHPIWMEFSGSCTCNIPHLKSSYNNNTKLKKCQFLYFTKWILFWKNQFHTHKKTVQKVSKNAIGICNFCLKDRFVYFWAVQLCFWIERLKP